MNDTKQTIRLLLVDDHAMFLEGLTRTFELQDDLEVVGQCGSIGEALEMLDRRPGVVVLDVDLGNERGLEFITRAKEAGYAGKILVVTAGVSGQEAVQLIQAGAAGILHKHQSLHVLCETIRKVAAGEACLEPQYLPALFHSVDRSRTLERPALTERDRAVLRYILQGLTNREIGAHLNVSEGAVKASLRLLFDKLAVRTRAQLVKVALEQYRDEI